ncbi:MAG TPA: sulfotransferase family protein [Gammaproteobacteria bacterium]|nr:sulfotransferase family protein [Gammaproteobacteria bacterium]
MSTENNILGILSSKWGADEKLVKSRLAQSSFVSLKYRYVYIEVPKAACTRVKNIIHHLEKLPPVSVTFDRLPETRLYMFIHDRQLFQLPSLITLQEKKAISILGDKEYFRFTFVRNPYSRLVSAWKNKLYFVEPGMEDTYIAIKNAFPGHLNGRYVGFEGFVRYLREDEDVSVCNPHYRLQKRLIFPNAINYDYIGQVEQFDTGIKEFGERIGVHGLNGMTQGPANESDGGDWRSHYTEKLAEHVYNLYKEDFDQFGYKKDSWMGGGVLEEKTTREKYLEDQIFDRNRLISQMYQWINLRMNKR